MDIACDVNTLFAPGAGRVPGSGYRILGQSVEAFKQANDPECLQIPFAFYPPGCSHHTDFLTPPHPLCYNHSTPFKSNPERLKKVAPNDCQNWFLQAEDEGPSRVRWEGFFLAARRLRGLRPERGKA